LKINVTAEQLAACIKAHEEALVHHIRDCGQSHPPADGSIGRIMVSIEALRMLTETMLEAAPAAAAPSDEIDVGATDKGERVTVKKRVIHGRKEG
jgi:hypothetical protein